MDESQPPYTDVVPTQAGFTLPSLKWRELVFVGALRPEGGAFVRDAARALPPFRLTGLFPIGVSLLAVDDGERVAVSRADGLPLRPAERPLATSTLHADLVLARRIESAWAAGAAAAVEAANRLDPACAAALLPVGGGVAAFVGLGGPLTHVLGFGLEGPLALEQLDAIEEFYRSRQSDVPLELSPLAEPALFEALGRRGYRLVALESVLVRSWAGPRPAPPGGVAVELVDPDQRELWVRLLALGFHGSETDEAMLFTGRVLGGSVGGGALIARIDGRAVGAAGWAIHAGVARFYADATLSDARGRGVQSALIGQRLMLAAEAGCDLATASTAPGSTSQRNYERAGFRVAYTRVCLKREWNGPSGTGFEESWSGGDTPATLLSGPRIMAASRMTPRVLPRAQHVVSRKNIDADALKVLYRLKNHGYTAYLVGGGVRDLLLERKPKDFDIATSAHPQQVKKLFRNCFIIGRRFRLCHVRFGRKVVEVSTFRKLAEPEEGDTLIRRDNTFGNPEEDAFRRDFTVNAMFYDIADFSVIDYVSGLADLEARVIRTIGDPGVRFLEDPVRMFRAVALAARLDFRIDRDTAEAIRALRGEIVKSSPPRIVDEVYKVLRQGAARKTVEMLYELGILAYLLPEAERAMREGGEALLASLGRLDAYRNAGLAVPEQLTNPLLMGTLFVPLGMPLRRGSLPHRREAERAHEPVDDVQAELEVLGEEPPLEAAVPLAAGPLLLPFARRDLDRMQLILIAQKRLREVNRSPHVLHLLASRGYFEEALRWAEIHGGQEGQELAAYWRSLNLGEVPPPPELSGDTTPLEAEPAAPRKRRRRRRRRPSAPEA